MVPTRIARVVPMSAKVTSNADAAAITPASTFSRRKPAYERHTDRQADSKRHGERMWSRREFEEIVVPAGKHHGMQIKVERRAHRADAPDALWDRLYQGGTRPAAAWAESSGGT